MSNKTQPFWLKTGIIFSLIQLLLVLISVLFSYLLSNASFILLILLPGIYISSLILPSLFLGFPILTFGNKLYLAYSIAIVLNSIIFFLVGILIGFIYQKIKTTI